MVAITDDEVNVKTCFLPNETTTIYLYIIIAFIIMSWLIVRLYYICKYLLRRESAYLLVAEAKDNKCD